MKDKMITRTIAVKNATVMAIDTKDGNKVFSFTQPLTGTFKNDGEILKFVKKNFETDGIIIAYIVGITETEKLYGMPESLFMAYAQELPPRAKAEQDAE